MLHRGQIRWASPGICYVRQIATRRAGNSRNFSLYNTARTIRPSIARSRSSYSLQARNLSLFGWGSSSKPAAESNSDTGSLTGTDANIEIGPNSLNEIRSVRASHATSDSPDPSIQPPSPVNSDSNIVNQLSDAVSFPSRSETVTEILEGEADVSSTPERLGFLKEVCGLDYGWGPTAVMEWCVEHLHLTAGLSWTASIILLSTMLRLAMVKPMVMAQLESAKMKALKPVVDPIRAQVKQAFAEGNQQKALELNSEMRAIQQEYGVKMWRAFVPILIQFPFQYGAFRFLNAAGRLPVPSFTTENWLWNTDLSFSDPYYITPAISAGLIWLQFRISQKGSDLSSNPLGPAAVKMIGNILPVASFAFMVFQPGSVQLYFLTSGAIAAGTAAFLRQGAARRYFGLPPNQGDALPGIVPRVRSAITGSPSTTTASELIKPTKPLGGLQMRGTESSNTLKKAEEGPKKSSIDKVLDKWKETGKSWGKTPEQTKQENIVRYERNRQQQIQIDREMRNKAAVEEKERR